MATAAKPAASKGSFWGILFWIVVAAGAAYPQALPALIGIGVIALIIWGAAKAKSGLQPGAAKASTRRMSTAPAAVTQAASRSTFDGGSPTAGSMDLSTQYYPPLGDTGEIFDFDRRGMEARPDRCGAARRGWALRD